MSDAETLRFAPADPTATPLHLIAEPDLEEWLSAQPDALSSWIRRIGFTGALGTAHLVPTDGEAIAIVGYGTPAKRARTRFALGRAAASLPDGTYILATELSAEESAEQALAWLLASYRFDRYKAQGPTIARLVAPANVDAARLETIARGEALTRDLINTPASDMGPADLADAARTMAEASGATFRIIEGPELETGFPLIHAVGRAAARPPRLIDLRHGTAGPRITLVGKGVCFDTGGLNLKPGSSMGLMKKDMGGAANVLGLARMILETEAPVQLRVLIPAVENSVSGDSFRPQDVLTSRKGLTVEINNTDAEGRLVLADALALATEEETDLLISMATLTGAARVAVGPDIAPFFTDSDTVADALARAARVVADPVWRLPFHEPYEAMIEPSIADLDNAPAGGFAGSITAALFLRRFAEGAPRYLHFDVYGWQPSPAPSRPKGGVGQGIRALLHAIPDLASV